MKKIIIIGLVLVIIITGIIIVKENSGYTAYVYYKRDYSNKELATWAFNGEKINCSIDDLKELADIGCRVSWHVINGENCLGFTLSENIVLVVPGLSFDSGISDSYYLTF